MPKDPFDTHPPSEDRYKRMEHLRLLYKDLRASIAENVGESSREHSLAITKLEESLMWAIKAIVLQD